MTLDASREPAIAHCRAARRLARLFRIERLGGFERYQPDVVERLLQRRAAIIGELLALALTPVDSPMRSSELGKALRELGREVGLSQNRAQERSDVLENELNVRRGAGLTGLRGGTTGQLLGRG